MKLTTVAVINRLRNHSLKGSTLVSNVLVNTFTLSLLKCLYKEGLIQSITILNKDLNSSNVVDIYLRVVAGFSLLKNLKIFNSKNTVVQIKNIDCLNYKQATILVSNVKGITNTFYLKKQRLGGTLLLTC